MQCVSQRVVNAADRFLQQVDGQVLRPHVQIWQIDSPSVLLGISHDIGHSRTEAQWWIVDWLQQLIGWPAIGFLGHVGHVAVISAGTVAPCVSKFHIKSWSAHSLGADDGLEPA